MADRCKFLFIFLWIGIFFSQCTKFEDGRNISFRSVDRRLEKFSPWIFEKLEVDGVDKSAEFRADSSFFLELRFNIPRSRGSDELSLETTSNICYSLGEYKFTKPNKMKIYLLENGCGPGFTYYDYGPIFLDYWIEWEITRLTMKELQMKTSFQNQEYKLYLKSNR